MGTKQIHISKSEIRISRENHLFNISREEAKR
jgi:hypothetical protein